MTENANPKPNTFCCPELCSGDLAASKKFYSGLFGWEVSDEKMPEGGEYSVFKLEGEMVAGMYQPTPERLQAGVKPHWNLYIAVTDAQATAKKAAELGGKVLTEPFNAGGDTMANLEDDGDVKFCVWQIREHSEPTRINTVGSLCWGELYARDKEKATAFYSRLFGWEAKPFLGGPMPYTTFNLPGTECGIGGMIQITPEMQNWPPQWLPYILVDDADATAARVGELGGQMMFPAMDIPTVGRIGMFFDPQGAALAFIKPVKM